MKGSGRRLCCCMCDGSPALKHDFRRCVPLGAPQVQHHGGQNSKTMRWQMHGQSHGQENGSTHPQTHTSTRLCNTYDICTHTCSHSHLCACVYMYAYITCVWYIWYIYFLQTEKCNYNILMFISHLTSFIFFILFFNFTILYWFCQISK